MKKLLLMIAFAIILGSCKKEDTCFTIVAKEYYCNCGQINPPAQLGYYLVSSDRALHRVDEQTYNSTYIGESYCQ